MLFDPEYHPLIEWITNYLKDEKEKGFAEILDSIPEKFRPLISTETGIPLRVVVDFLSSGNGDRKIRYCGGARYSLPQKIL